MRLRMACMCIGSSEKVTESGGAFSQERCKNTIYEDGIKNSSPSLLTIP